MRAQACVYERACMCCKCLQWQARQTKDLRVMSAQACVHERAVRCSECLQLQARQTNCSPALRRGRHAWWSRAAPTTFQRLSTSLRAERRSSQKMHFAALCCLVCMQSEPVHLRARARHAMDACASMSMRGMYADMRADMRELRARMEKHAQRHLCEGDAAIGNAATISQLTRHQLRARTHNFMRSVCSEISGSFAGAERHRSRSQRNSEKTCRRRMLAISG